MSTLLPILALALALAAALLSRQSSEPSVERGRGAATIWALTTALLLFLVGFIWRGWYSPPTHVAIGLVIGAVGSIASRWLPSSARVVSSIALAGAIEGSLLLLPADWRLFAQLGAIAGAALAAWLLDVRSKSLPSCAVFPIALACVIAADVLGSKAMEGQGFQVSGTLLAITAGAAGVLARLFTMRVSKTLVAQAVAILLLGVGASVIGWRYLQQPYVGMLFLGGMMLGLVVHWLMDDEGDDAVRPLLATILWIGLGTLGFGMLKGYGMSVGLMGGVTTLVLLGNTRALLTLGPLAGLVMYRVFREVHVDATRALDIGQHYALIGLALGALTPLMPVEWLRSRWDLLGMRLPTTSVLWMFMLAMIPVGCALVLGPKGVVGFVAGLGFAALIESLKGDARYKVQDSTSLSRADQGVNDARLHTLSLGVGLAAATTFTFELLGDNTTLSRDEKVSILVPLAIALLVIAVLLVVVSPRAAVKGAQAQ